MTLRRGLAAGTVVSLLVVGAWSLLAAATTGPVPRLHLSWHHPLASYAALASAPTGIGWELFAVLSVIYTLCLLVAGWRKGRQR